MTFSDQALQAVEQSFLKLLRSGEWIKVGYDQKIQIDPAMLRGLYASIDMDRVKALLLPMLERQVADQIMASMATEIGSDVKKIMCNAELREDLRSVIREKIREAAKAVGKA